VLQWVQGCTPYLRPLIDEIEEPSESVTIVFKYLDDNLQNASNKRTLSRKELKYVSTRIIEALHTLHADGFVHTGKLFPLPECFLLIIVLDVNLDNVLINYGKDDVRFTDVQLGDCGSRSSYLARPGSNAAITF
jgi:serine/threonine protein kinase